MIFTINKSANWDLRHVPPDQIRSVWPQVKTMLDDLLSTCVGCDTWIPEDVYHEVKSGLAHLHVVGEPLHGCLVLKVLKDAYTGNPYLHVWIGYSSVLGAIARVMPDLERIARSVNANRITCHSPFLEFESAGFTQKLMIFERRI